MNDAPPPPPDLQFSPDQIIFHGDGVSHARLLSRRGAPPPWRDFSQLNEADHPKITAGSEHWRKIVELRGKGYVARPEEIRAVNLALYLRRPLLIYGPPGTGKSTLAYAIAYELGLGPVLTWPITSRSTWQQGLYHYDAIGRLNAAPVGGRTAGKTTRQKPPAEDIGKFLRLGPLGTALATSTNDRPAVLLIDEIDKSDIDLPNDLLHVFEEGNFEIPELSRMAETHPKISIPLHRGEGAAEITGGRVGCVGFPLVIMTSNGERDFSPAFHRRCVRLDIQEPTPQQLTDIVRERVSRLKAQSKDVQALIEIFQTERADPARELATDQLLNAVFLRLQGVGPISKEQLREIVFRPLTNAPVERFAPKPEAE